jgi:hypothetical protein
VLVARKDRDVAIDAPCFTSPVDVVEKLVRGVEAPRADQVGGRRPFRSRAVPQSREGSTSTPPQIQVTGNLFGGGTVVALLTLDGIADGTGPLAGFSDVRLRQPGEGCRA